MYVSSQRSTQIHRSLFFPYRPCQGEKNLKHSHLPINRLHTDDMARDCPDHPVSNDPSHQSRGSGANYGQADSGSQPIWRPDDFYIDNVSNEPGQIGALSLAVLREHQAQSAAETTIVTRGQGSQNDRQSPTRANGSNASH